MSKKSSRTPSNNDRPLVVLGIDPGYGRLGISVIEKRRAEKEALLFSTCIETDKGDDIYDRFKDIGKEVSCVLDKYKPEEMAMESLFIAKNQKTAMRVAEVRGIIIYEAVKRNIAVHEYSPLQIKSAITGDGASDKMRMIKMIGLLIDIKNKDALDDEYDAIAVALTHLSRRQSFK